MQKVGVRIHRETSTLKSFQIICRFTDLTAKVNIITKTLRRFKTNSSRCGKRIAHWISGLNLSLEEKHPQQWYLQVVIVQYTIHLPIYQIKSFTRDPQSAKRMHYDWQVDDRLPIWVHRRFWKALQWITIG